MPGKFMPHELDSGRFSSFPTAMGTLTRFACARVQAAGIKLEPLLAEAGLTFNQIKDRSARLSVQHQIKFLNIAAAALQDDLLGYHIAEACDIREFGLLYYVPASSQTLGDGLRRGARYTSMVNESLSIQYREGNRIRIIFRLRRRAPALRQTSDRGLLDHIGPALPTSDGAPSHSDSRKNRASGRSRHIQARSVSRQQNRIQRKV